MEVMYTGPKDKFIPMVNEDIGKCKDYLDNPNDEDMGRNLYIEVTAKYSGHIAGLGQGLYGYDRTHGFFHSDMNKESIIHNIMVIYNKLIAFKNYGYKNRTGILPNEGVNVINHNDNALNANQEVSINISFEDVINRISEMTGISEAEEKEALNKVEEIRAIVELREPKKTKWQKLKPILGWLADKSVDIGMTIIPLLLKI